MMVRDELASTRHRSALTRVSDWQVWGALRRNDFSQVILNFDQFPKRWHADRIST
jgi:hypothetical protein